MENLVLFLLLGVLSTGWPLLCAQSLPNALTVVSSRASVTATTGDPRVSLTCNVKGGATEVNTFCASNQFLLWRVNGTLLNETSYESDFLAQGNCTHSNLIFLRVFPELEGRYTCELSNNQTVLAMTGVNIRPGCNPGIFRGNVAVGKTVTTPCGSIHPAFNSEGRVQWTCEDHLTWREDFTECTMLPSYNKSILLFLYRVTVSPISSVSSLLMEPDRLERDFLDNVVPNVFGPVEASGRLADIRAGASWMAEVLVLFAVEPQGPVDHGGIVQEAQRPVMLAGQIATPVYTGNPKFVPSDTCTCPRLWSEFSGALLDRIPVIVSFCRAPKYVKTPCQCLDGCQCTGVFYDIGSGTVNCTLDTDGDGIPNVEDTCEGCCVGEVNSGYMWKDTPIQSSSLVSCASIHPSFNAKSYAARRCTASPAGLWGAVSVSGCAFIDKADRAIVVMEANVNLMYVQESGQTITEAVMNEVTMQFSAYGLLDMDIRVSGESHVVVVLEFPTDVSKDVVQVYQQSALVLFSSTPLVYGHVPANTCPCSPTEPSLSEQFIQTCIGPPGKLCECSGESCRCIDPYARTSSSDNSTVICGVDSDGDGIADVDDRCPDLFDLENACLASIEGPVFEDNELTCASDADPIWGIVWSQTAAGNTDTKRCPGGISSAKGIATRSCGLDGQWEKPNVRACESYQFNAVRSMSMEVEGSLNTLPAFSERSGTFRVDVSSGSVSVLMDGAYTLMSGTQPGTKPLLPMDIDATLVFLEVVTLLSEVTTLFADGDFDENMMFSIIDNILATINQEQFELLNEFEDERSANLLLELVERISKTYSFNLDTHPDASSEMDENGIANIFHQWDGLRIFVSAELISPITRPMGVPKEGSTRGAPPRSFDRPDMVPAIDIPTGLIEERAQAMGDTRVSVVTVVVSTLADFLPMQAEEGVDENATLASVIIASQVSLLGGDSTSLRGQPVQIQFPATNAVRAGASTTCVFWNFSAPTTSGRVGGWSMSGLDRDDVASSSSDVTCFSSHLTSFAILVDASGVTGGIPPEEALAFDIVSYIGCAVSLVCLILTVVFYLSQGRELYKKVVNFVHLNLSIALICGLVVFVTGIQTATWSKIACGFVAALLHYFFLAAFSWMMCEGICLYLMLVKVFGANKKKWLLMYTILGWCTPLPIVALSVGIRYDFYRVPQSYDTNSTLYHQTRACWLPTEHGVIAAFIVPMLVMILINCVFGAMALWSVFKFKRDQAKRSMEKVKERNIAIALMKAMVILLPILGLTWVIGLLAVGPYTTVFAWIFLFLNGFQGAFIFFFHVVRHDKVWPVIKKAICRVYRKTKSIEADATSSKRSKSISTSDPLNRTNTNLSILGDSRKTSINEVSFAHDDISLEKAIPEAVNEEDEIKGEESKL